MTPQILGPFLIGLMFMYVHYQTQRDNHPLHWKIISGLAVLACIYKAWRGFDA